METENLENLNKQLTAEEIESNKKDDWLKFLRVRFDFPEDYDLIKSSDLKRLKRKKYFSGFLTGFFILLGLLAIAGSLFYGVYYDKLKSTLICGNATAICGDNNCPACPSSSCPDCNCGSCDCGNVTLIPNINIYNNSTA